MAIFKWLSIVLGSLVLVIVLLLVLLDGNVVRDYTVRQLSQMTGRRLTIAGALDIDWSLTPRIHTEQIRFENASWSREPYMLELEALDFRLNLLALLSGRLVIPELTLTKPRVILDISSEGRPNWVFRSASVAEAETEVSEKPPGFPTIERLWIDDGLVTYRDLSKATDISATITTVHVEGGHKTLNVQAQGKLEGEPISVRGQGGSVPGLRETDDLYPITLQLQTASATVKAEGTIEQPLQLKGLDLAVDVQGEGRLPLLAFAGISSFTSPAYRLQTHLSRHDNLWRLNEFRAAVGQSDVSGQATIEIKDTRPFLQATLTSSTLDTVQLQAALETDNTVQIPPPRNVAATAPDERPLQAFDANVTWQIQDLVLPQGKLDEIMLQVELHAGQLHIDPLQVAIGEGIARVQAMVDARARPVQGSLQAALDGVSVARILTLMGMDVANTGTLDGEINLSLTPSVDPEVHLTPASLLRRLDVDTSALNYRDAATGTEVDVTIRPEHIDGKSMIKLVGQGRYQNQKVDCEAAADTLARLVADQKHVYTVKADVATQDTQTQLHMTLGDPAATGETTMQVAIEGENPAALALFLGISLPALAHYQLKGNVRRTGEGWHIDRITAAAAGVDLRGDITISTSGERPLIQGDVVIAELNVPHLLEAFDKGSAVASARSNRTTASNASVNLAPLRAVDAEVKISARRIEAPHLPLEHVVMQVALHDGKLQVAPVKLQLYDGHIAADIGSDTTARPLEGTIRGTIKRLDLGKILQPFVDTNQLTGTLSGHLNLVATGIDLNPARADVTMPFLEHLMIKESHLTYTDPAHHLDAQATINTEGLDSRAQMVHIDAQGLYQQEPFTLRFRGEPLLNLRETNQSYALEATINAVQTEVHVKGHLLDPLALRRMDMRLAVAGPNPKLLSPLLGLPLPALPPYKVQGQLLRRDHRWKLLNFEGRVGDSDLAGDIQITTGGERPFVRADLTSRHIDFDDLGPLIGEAPDTGLVPQEREQVGEEASPTVLPKDRIHFDHLHRLDAAVNLRAKHIKSILSLDDLTAKMTMQAGRLTIAPLDVGVASGRIHSRIELDATLQPTRANVEIEIRHVSLQEIVAQFGVADKSVGWIGGQAKVWLQGDSVADMLASADGGLLLLMSGGQFDDLLVELAGLDVGEAIAALFGDQKQKFIINCAFADMHAKQGVAKLKTFIVDTDDTLFLAEGTIDLSQEGMDLIIDPKPKDLSLFSARAPLYIKGTFAAPRMHPGESAIIRGAASLAMLPVAPLAVLIPLLNPNGSDKPGDDRQSAYCSGLMDAINKAR